jgi:hypothetical protein
VVGKHSHHICFLLQLDSNPQISASGVARIIDLSSVQHGFVLFCFFNFFCTMFGSFLPPPACLKIRKGARCNSVVEHLPNMHKALGLPSRSGKKQTP